MLRTTRRPAMGYLTRDFLVALQASGKPLRWWAAAVDLNCATLSRYAYRRERVRLGHGRVLRLARRLGVPDDKVFESAETLQMSASPALPSVPVAGAESAGPPCHQIK